MWVYGDIEHERDLSAEVEALRRRIVAVASLPADLDAHGELVGLLIAASGLVQGVTDAEFAVAGRDARSARQDAGSRLLLALAKIVAGSWLHGFAAQQRFPTGDILADLSALDGLDSIRIRHPEGHAFYAVYPEAYLAAAHASGLPPETRVIGIRSIGCGLAAMVAAGLGAAPPLTLRPVGDPFRREIRAAPSLAREIAERPRAPVAVVDEGPGLSGSSFAAAVAWLAGSGVPAGSIHLFPSHPGEPGGEAGSEQRRWWGSVQRHPAGTDAVLSDDRTRYGRLAAWVADLVGPLDEPLRDISAGGWRALSAPSDPRPPVDPRMERLKFLAVSRGEPMLVKFAGLGDDGRRKLDEARRLGEAGFVPPVAGLVHGFLVSRWVPGIRIDAAAFDRGDLVEHLGRYLGFRSRIPPSNAGADLGTLAAMAAHNVGLALGDEAGERVRLTLRDAPGLSPTVRLIGIDGRLHPFEWIVSADGRLLKTDALDHSAGHDLVGCQDVAWDVAGAITEFDLSAGEAERLAASVEGHSGHPVDSRLLAAMRLCYVAHQIGLWSTAAAATERDDAARALARTDALKRRLRPLIA